jgi:hypothetical protein
MLHTTTLWKVLLTTFLLLSLSGQTSETLAGLNVWTSNGPEGGAVQAIAIDPATPTTLYAGTAGGVFKSMNGGGNWSAANNGLTDSDVWALAIDPATPTILYAGTRGGACSRAWTAPGPGARSTPA